MKGYGVRVTIDEEADPRNPPISLAVARFKSRGECPHARVYVDEELHGLECQDCGAVVHAVGWIHRYLVKLAHLQRVTLRHRAMANLVAQRTRTKCVHCGQMTPLGGRPTHAAVEAEVHRLEAAGQANAALTEGHPDEA